MSKRKSDMQLGEGSVKKRREAPSSLTGNRAMVTVILKLAEGDSQTFPIHKEFLCHYSAYFRAAFKSNFKEGQTQTVELEDIIPDVFGTFADWIYTQQIKAHISKSSLVLLWLLGDRFIVPQLQNRVMDILIAEGGLGMVRPDLISHSYHQSTVESPVRRYLAGQVLKDMHNTKTKPFPYSSYTSELLAYLLEILRRRGTCKVKSPSHQELYVKEEDIDFPAEPEEKAD